MIEKKTMNNIIMALAVAGLLGMGYVFLQINAVPEVPEKSPATGQATGMQQIDTRILPKGAPLIYGAELGVSYDDVSAANPAKADAAIARLGQLDNSIKLDAAQKERYTRIVLQMSCEYCCGAESIIFENGEPACGCQHSYAMRGVAKYLIKNHPDEFTDEQILEEMSKWKTLFFPAQIAEKSARLQKKGIETSYVNLASNKYRNE
ncbi:hypothetical protein HY640_02185 [Candidatus Woesearchaeota archaeon]|nr:hypothetical protein [Candidatus Woesearchaeota archaeon]